jgi:tetratricopeptide (TPR) repeat protein
MRAQILRAALSLSLLSPLPVHAQSNGVAALNEQGWKALQDGDADRAMARFTEALTLRPSDPVLLLGAGASAHVQGKPRDAMTRLKRALEIEPRLTEASKLLGAIAYQQGETELAIRTYEAALKFAPNDAHLTAELAVWRDDAKAHERFEERRYDRFRVMFEGRAEESLAAQATAILNSAFWRITGTLGEFPADTVVAVLYTEKQFRDITRAPEWAGGQYDGRIRIPAAGAPQNPELFERVLTHELAHAICLASSCLT